MNNTIIIIGVIVLAVILIFRFGFNSSTTTDDFNSKTRPNNSEKPTKPIDNDKLVLVKNLKLDYLKQAIEQFCNMYNQETYSALPRLFILDNQYVITFPYNIDFERLCFFINYLENAYEVGLQPDYKPVVKAWCSTKYGDAWMKDSIVNKKVMIYIPEWDEEHDNVYLVTQENLGFKMGFANGEASQKLDRPLVNYENNPIEINSLKNKEIIDFE